MTATTTFAFAFGQPCRTCGAPVSDPCVDPNGSGAPAETHDARLIAAAVARSKQEILADIEDGRVPDSVSSFGDLHGHVDANEYGGLTEAPFYVEGREPSILEIAEDVQSRVDSWLRAGRPMDDGAEHAVVVTIRAREYRDEPFTDADLLAAVRATLHEVFPFDDGYPVVPTVGVFAGPEDLDATTLGR